jgi:hypothetical protein
MNNEFFKNLSPFHSIDDLQTNLDKFFDLNYHKLSFWGNFIETSKMIKINFVLTILPLKTEFFFINFPLSASQIFSERTEVRWEKVSVTKNGSNYLNALFMLRQKFSIFSMHMTIAKKM